MNSPWNVIVLEIDEFVPVFIMVHETRGVVNTKGRKLIELKYNKMPLIRLSYVI